MSRTRVVASAALEVVGLSVGVLADVALGNVKISIRSGLKHGSDLVGDVLHIGLGVLIRTHEIESREHHGIDSRFMKIVDHQCRRHKFALCQDLFFFKKGENRLAERADEVETLLHCRPCLFAEFLGRIKFIYRRAVFGLKHIDSLFRTGEILLIEIVGNLYKSVGGTRHC